MRRHPVLALILRRDFIAGLMFIAVAALGLWLSRAYPVGTALRMGTGYMPRLLCWVLMALGAAISAQSLLQGATGSRGAAAGDDGGANDAGVKSDEGAHGLLPVLIVPASLVAFGLGLGKLGLVVSVALLVGIASLAGRGLRPWETIATAAVLAAMSWLIFILGLGLAMPVWPDFSAS